MRWQIVDMPMHLVVQLTAHIAVLGDHSQMRKLEQTLGKGYLEVKYFLGSHSPGCTAICL